MREILFRGKRIDNGEWVYGYYAHVPHGRFDADEHMIQTVNENGKIGHLYDIRPETVGQYTGLTDKNGKEIFEGDIIQTAKYGKDGRNGSNFNGKDVFQISFEDGGYCLQNEWRRFNLRPDAGIEVIGNIHDNPELIGGVGDE